MAERHHQPSTSGVRTNSDFMDVDEVLVVPDTPDRVSRQTKNIRSVEFSSRSSGVASRVTRDRMNRHFGDSARSAGMHSRGDVGVKAQIHDVNCTNVPSSSFSNAPMSSMAVGNTLTTHKDIYHRNRQHLEDGKVSKSSSIKSSHHHKRSEDPVFVEFCEIAESPTSTRGNLGVRMRNKDDLLPNRSSSLHTAGNFSKPNRSNYKEKDKVDYDNPVNCDTHSVKQNDNNCLGTSDNNTGKGLFVPSHTFRIPRTRTTEKKRLVRNGCISPQNIANAKRLEETSGNGFENTECAVIAGGSHPVTEVNEVTSKQSAASRAKGKGLLIHDSSSRGYAGRRSHAGYSTGERCKGKYPEKDCVSVQDTDVNSNKVVDKSTSSIPSSSFVQKPAVSEGQRQRKHGLSSGSPLKSTEVICLNSGAESSTKKSVRDHGGFLQRELGSQLAFDEPCLEPIDSTSQADGNSDVMASQLLADEMLARELQEQLYNEIPESTSVERLSSLGLHLPEEQLGDSLQLASSRRNHQVHHFVGPPPSNRRQASQSHSLRNRLFRRGTQARLPRSNVPRLRSHIHHQGRRRDRLFPSQMDLDMRMELLEALEAVVSDDVRMVNQLLDSDREFGENDYEMLLALDENNHTHLGASAAQITDLPESTVNTDNSEVCSICLETPAIGDTMRHLPCLHKFHKDCIDPWLRRKRSCPVCKSDI